MPWMISDQAFEAHDHAQRHDQPTAVAMERLWARLALDPENEGVPLSEAGQTSDPNMKRILKALQRLTKATPGPEPRVAYEHVDGPASPPPHVVVSVHRPNSPRLDDHTLIALTRVDRHGNARP